MIEACIETGSAFPARGRRPAVTHTLKCWPKFFDAIVDGRKRHDLRRVGDRDFQVGDLMMLREFSPDADAYTGRVQAVRITYITSALEPCALSDSALHEDFCILSIVPVAGV